MSCKGRLELNERNCDGRDVPIILIRVAVVECEEATRYADKATPGTRLRRSETGTRLAMVA